MLTTLEQSKKIINGKEIWKTYFKCPYCNEEYDTTYDDLETMSLRKQIRKMAYDLQVLSLKSKKQKQLMKALKNKKELLKRCELELTAKYNVEENE